ncbi:MAG: DUF5652 family protein [Parcubacteria group bacterium]
MDNVQPSDFLGALAGMWFLMIVLIAWSVAWKGIALWKAARLGHTAWFVVMLILNTVGILEIIYIFAVANRQGKKVESSKA